MQISSNRWIAPLVVSAVLALGAWGLQGIVEPDGGKSPAPERVVACSAPSHLTMTYSCQNG